MLLVTGATGTIGRLLIDALLNQGAKVRAITHNPQAANLPAEVEVVEGDLSWPAIAPFLEGVTALFLHPRAVGLAAGELLGLAANEGYSGVWVALSATNVDSLDRQPSGTTATGTRRSRTPPSPAAWRGEPTGQLPFAANTLRTWGAQIRAGDVVRYPYANFAEALIHERDLAEVIAHAAQRRPRGPQSRLAGADRPAVAHPPAAGRHHRAGCSRAEPALPGGSRQRWPWGMVQQGIPEAFVEALMARYAREVRAAGAGHRRGGADPRPPRAPTKWVADHAAAFGTNKNSREQPMKLTIFAATGGIGRQALEQALAAGHDVTAVVETRTSCLEKRSVSSPPTAAADPAALESAVAGADAVLSGPWSTVDLRDRHRVAGHAGHRPGDAGNRRATHRRGQARPSPRRALAGRPKPPGLTRARVLHAAPVQSRCQDRVPQEAYADLALMEDISATAAWTGPSCDRHD